MCVVTKWVHKGEHNDKAVDKEIDNLKLIVLCVRRICAVCCT